MTVTIYHPNQKHFMPILGAVCSIGLASFMVTDRKASIPISLICVFAVLMSAILVAGVNAQYRSCITCGPDAIKYSLPHASVVAFMLHPFRLRRGALPYSAIRGVETRRMGTKFGLCTLVCLVQDDRPRATFAISAAGDHQWIDDFAADVARRARVQVVDHGLVSAFGANKW
jgi:hypothetical protein